MKRVLNHSFGGAVLVFCFVSAQSETATAQIPGFPCASHRVLSTGQESEACPKEPQTFTTTFEINCHPICYTPITYVLQYTSEGACLRNRHCPPTPPIISATWGLDGKVITYSNGFYRWNSTVCRQQNVVDYVFCANCDSTWRDCREDPLIISTKDAKYELTSAEGGVLFDLDGDGKLDKIPWLAGSDDGFLVLDRNGNGIIDNGVELFSHSSPQVPSASPNGFLALAMFDNPLNGGDGDEKINSGDKIFSSLRLWMDSNQDAVTDPGELVVLSDVGLMELELKYTDEKAHADKHGNTFLYSAPTYFADRRVIDAWAVFFAPCASSKK